MFDDKVIVVLGAAGLIGSKIVESFSSLNATVVIADIDFNKCTEISNSLNGQNVLPLEIDILSTQKIAKNIKIIEKQFGKIDVVINTAYPKSKNFRKDIFSIKYEEFNEDINIHLGGFFNVMQQFSLFFKKQGYGNIINLASIYGVITPKFEIYNGTNMGVPAVYVAAKSSIISLTKYFAKLLKGYQIRVNCISPGGIFDCQDKKFIKQYESHCLNKGMLELRDIIGTVNFLSGDGSKYINGTNIVIDDGFTL